MEYSNFTYSESLIIVCCIGLLGLLAGYAIRIIAYRLPAALAIEWISQAKDILKEDSGISDLSEVKRDTTPEKSLIFVGTSILTVLTFHRFGLAMESVMLLIFTWGALILALIDTRHHLLPDTIIYPMIWIGLISNNFNLFSTLSDALWGVVCGYAVLWIVLSLYKIATKQDGVGHGDLKMLAMLGAWTGWQLLPLIILIASALGVAAVLAFKLINKHKSESPIPFGPYLAIAGWVSLLWGKQLNSLI